MIAIFVLGCMFRKGSLSAKNRLELIRSMAVLLLGGMLQSLSEKFLRLADALWPQRPPVASQAHAR
jgi:hypothetical protein